MKLNMLILFTLLIALPKSSPTNLDPFKYACKPGSPEECKKASFVPGHTLLGQGLDIVTMKKTGAFLLDMQIYQMANKTCTLCENPYNKKILEKLPISMVDWTPQAACTRNIESSLMNSKVSLANKEASNVQNDWKVGLDIPIKTVTVHTALAGSHSKLAEFAQSKTITDQYSFLSHELSCAFYRFRLSFEPPLTEDFTKSLQQLPNNYKYNKEEYRKLIAKYGTHYIVQAMVGGKVSEVTALRTCQVAMEGMTLDAVKDCLGVEAKISAGFPIISPSISSEFRRCKEIAKTSKRGDNFHSTFNERIWEVKGGKVTFDLLNTEGGKGSREFEEWMKSLKTDPDVLTYSVEPIHELVRVNGPKKENLRIAVSEYIKENALTKKCFCPRYSPPSQGPDCSCTCPLTKYMNSDCCPTNQGMAKVSLKIQRAQWLPGEFLSAADGYAIFMYDGKEVRTPTVWNNNNPIWNSEFEFDLVQLSQSKMYTIEVWDRNIIFSDRFLGRCNKLLKSGILEDTCYLGHGSITYTITANCVPHLQGLYCQDYSPVPPKQNP
ncbi:perforin-1 [Xenopus tropicalis]|uniref:Perforin-1 n=1 Tax=Xenopus tropicalis TaxID=8364 RepID=A0A7D9NLH5_XENTR|nr:perforin-1 [Xenopus tropicalis]